MPTYYVEDYDGKRNDDAVEPVVLSPVVEDDVETKVVTPKPAKKAASSKVDVETA